MRLSPDANALEGLEEDLEMCDFVEDLASVQEFSESQLVVPEDVSSEIFKAVQDAARWTRGETTEMSWKTF